MSFTFEDKIRSIFYPQSVAIVGASNDERKLGGLAARAILRSGFKGRVFLVNTRSRSNGENDGHKIYSSIASLPQEVESFVFVVPREEIPESLEAAGQKGGKVAVIIASGFQEVGEAGKQWQETVRQIAERYGMIIVGPNSVGVVNFHNGLNATFAHTWCELFSPGGIAVLTQSGGVGQTLMSQLANHNLGVSKYIHLGNRANLEFADMLRYFEQDEDTRIVILFLEGTDDARRLYRAMRSCASKKKIVALHGGVTGKGSRAALSHTGSMAGVRRIYQGAFRQAGVLEVETTEEAADVAKALYMLPPLKNPGAGVFVFTHTAGPSILATDVLSERGVPLPEPPERARRALESFLPDFASLQNPIDMGGGAAFNHYMYVKAMDAILAEDTTGAAIIIYSHTNDPAFRFPVEAVREVRDKYAKPVMVSIVASAEVIKHEMNEWEQAGFPVYLSPERAAKVMARFYQFYRLRHLRGQEL
ncbi:MAG: hypothetical protein D9V47_14660 [Clostridia bacterium]|nr:MAG: hypothetical protein D9V47_14660 [Clostridia bacterium]